MSETLIKSERIYEGSVINLRVDTVKFDNGSTGKREVVEHNGAVAIVPMIDDDHVLLVKQYRTAAGKTLLELPAGTLNKGEEPEAAARREIVEEIDYKAETMERLFGMYTAPGFSTEYLTVFLATGLTPEKGTADDDEFLEVSTLSLSEAIGKIGSEIEDAKSIAGLLAVAQRYRK